MSLHSTTKTGKKNKVSAIIAAAGRGERAGFPQNKLLTPLYGAPALWHTLKKFDIPEVDEVIIASSVSDYREICALAAPFGFKVIIGGKTRSESVKNALAAVSGDIVLIHDGARPFVSRNLIIKCIDGVKRFGSAICALPETDTAAAVERGKIIDYYDRASLCRLQTPQGFFTADIHRAYELAGDGQYTDDSSVYKEFIDRPHIVEGEKENVKLTYAEDFKREFQPAAVCAPAQRAGFGVDVHAFCEGNKVILGGVEIGCDKALLAHSDGDVVYHAIIDALLSAAGLKDIGHYFPDSDSAYENAASLHMCALALEEVKKAGYAPLNISISVQAEKPRLAAYVDKMISNVADVLQISHECVAIAAGTCEHLGFVGEGLGIAAYAYALLQKI